MDHPERGNERLSPFGWILSRPGAAGFRGTQFSSDEVTSGARASLPHGVWISHGGCHIFSRTVITG